MAVIVYFTNGNHATIKHATSAKWAFIGVEGEESRAFGLVCTDQHGREVAQFIGNEVVGYQVENRVPY